MTENRFSRSFTPYTRYTLDHLPPSIGDLERLLRVLETQGADPLDIDRVKEKLAQLRGT